MNVNIKYRVTYKDSYNIIPVTNILTENEISFKKCTDTNFIVIRKEVYFGGYFNN